MLPFLLALVATVTPQPSPPGEGLAVPGLIGHWDCAGHFTRTGKPIAATIDIRPGESPNALSLIHRDKPPTTYRASELWVFGAGAQGGRAAIADASGMRWFETETAPDRIVLARADDKGPLEKFVYTLRGGAGMTVDWLHRGLTAELVVGDTITCRLTGSE
jgi:hypothetical protein